MKYRIVTDHHKGFSVESKYWGFWRECGNHGTTGANSFDNVKEAEDFISQHIEERMKIKASGKVVKIFDVTTPEDHVFWKLKGK